MAIFFKDMRLAHLSRGDAFLFQKFHVKQGDKFRDYRFDVRVGGAVKVPKDSPSWLIDNADALSRKRIDVVMEDNKNIYVVELRVRAKANVLGDLIAYRFLYMNQFVPIKPVVPILVTDAVEPDLLISLHELKMLFFIV